MAVHNRCLQIIWCAYTIVGLYSKSFFAIAFGLLGMQILSYSQVSNNLAWDYVPMSVRAAGMGGAYSAIASDAGGWIANPAGLTQQKSLLLSGAFFSETGRIGTSLGTTSTAGCIIPLSYIFPSASNTTVAINWVRMLTIEQESLPDLLQDPTDRDNINNREIRVRNARVRQFIPQSTDGFSLSVAHKFIATIDWGWNKSTLPIEFPVGINIKALNSRVFDINSSAFAVDAAAMMKINLKDMTYDDSYPVVTFALGMYNIGSVLQKWDNATSSRYPQYYSFGMSASQPLPSLQSDVVFSYEYRKVGEWSTRIGLEWLYDKFLSLRCGYFGTTATLGAGADLGFLSADYAYQFSSESILGDVHRLQCSFRIERLFKKQF